MYFIKFKTMCQKAFILQVLIMKKIKNGTYLGLVDLEEH